MPAEFAPFGAFLIATLVGLGLTALTFVVSRKAGLAPVQAQLIDTLQDTVAAQGDKIDRLESELSRETQQRVLMQQAMSRLRDGMADLAAENAELRHKLGMPRSERLA